MPPSSQIYAIIDAQNSSKNVTQDSQRKSGFLRLPPEIRNKVYELASTGRSVSRRTSTKPPLKKYDATAFALLQICHQIRREATPILFSHATFDSGIIEQKEVFGPSSLACIRFMTVELVTAWYIWSNRTALVKKRFADWAQNYRSTFTGLEHVYMYVANWSSRPGDSEIEKATSEVFGKPELVMVCGEEERYQRPNGAYSGKGDCKSWCLERYASL